MGNFKLSKRGEIRLRCGFAGARTGSGVVGCGPGDEAGSEIFVRGGDFIG